MKWYFCINEEALSKRYSTDIDLAVQSCIQNTALEPHVLFDGKQGTFTDRMKRLGVCIHFRRTSLANDIAHLPDGPYELPGFRHIVARGAYLRFDIADIECHDEFVLYTDCDVMFRKEIKPEIRPPFLAASLDQPDGSLIFNSGVMILNIPNLRKEYALLIEFTRDRLAKYGAEIRLIRDPYDQPILNEYYAGRWIRLPLEYNWRPYWGFNEDAAIVHLQGPKIEIIRQILGGARNEDLQKYSRSEVVLERWRKVVETNPEGYRGFMAEADLMITNSSRDKFVLPWKSRITRFFRASSVA
jgi:hypothetical protein